MCRLVNRGRWKHANRHCNYSWSPRPIAIPRLPSTWRSRSSARNDATIERGRFGAVADTENPIRRMRNGIRSFVRRNLRGRTVSGTNQNRPAPGTTTGFHITPPIPHHETPGEIDPAITCRGCQPPRGRITAGTAVTVVVVAHAKFVKSSTGCGQNWRPPSNDCRNCRTRWRRCEPSWPNSPTCDRWPRTRARPPAVAQ